MPLGFSRLSDKQLLALSVVVRIELLSWAGSPADMQLRADFIAATSLLGLDEFVVQKTIDLRQRYRVKLPDAIIAATALVHGLPLLIRNTGDFKAFADLMVLNPHEPAQLSVI